MSQSQTRATTDHDDIRQWAGAHDAIPACVRATSDDTGLGVPTFDIAGYGASETELAHVEGTSG